MSARAYPPLPPLTLDAWPLATLFWPPLTLAEMPLATLL